jgi:hypothetical protein
MNNGITTAIYCLGNQCIAEIADRVIHSVMIQCFERAAQEIGKGSFDNTY